MKNCFVFLLVLFSVQLVAQNNKEDALIKAKEAIRLMDEGKIDESIELLEESIKLDPINIDYPYEIGYAHYINKEYNKAIEVLTPLTRRRDVSDRIYQLLGNSFDLIGERDKAIEIYESGLKKLPGSGKLHLELGGMYQHNKEYDKAIGYYEKGIEVEPSFSSNYYRLAKVFLSSDEEIWGMMYGEIFMNLERNSNRTAEISKMLYDTYKTQIQFTSDTSFSVSFSKSVIDVGDLKKNKIPFGMAVYEPTLILSMFNEKEISLSSLNRIRTNFVKNYFGNNWAKKYPNVLFSYQDKILSKGHFEDYNFWILMKGDENEFTKWQEANSAKWEDFVGWFNPNAIEIDEKSKFVRTQY